MQADDWLFPQCLELMVDTAERDPSIGVVGAYALEGRTVEFDGLPYPSPVVTGRAVCRLFYWKIFTCSTPPPNCCFGLTLFWVERLFMMTPMFLLKMRLSCSTC